MFGLMKYYRCASSQKERDRYRQQYCGVCKSLGKLYGRHTRFLLNRDLVFLSEVLTELSPEEFPSEAAWNRPLSGIINCFKAPKGRDDIPRSLQIAAAYNVLMSRFKLEDNIADTRRAAAWLWKAVRVVFSRALKKSSQQAEEWGYPLEETGWWMDEQRRREADRNPPEDADAALNYFAEPSAHTSGLSMKHAALTIERADKADLMYNLGYSFGKLIYLLDALEDFEEDFEKRQFNALRAAYRLDEKALPSSCVQKIRALSRLLEQDTHKAISALQLSERKEAQFTQRLTRNLTRKIDREAYSAHAKCDRIGQKMKLREKWRYAKELSRKFTFVQTEASPFRLSKAYVTFLLLAICIFSTPRQILGSVVTQLKTNATNDPDCSSFTLLFSWLSLTIFQMAGQSNDSGNRINYCDCCDCSDCCDCIDCRDHADCNVDDGCNCDGLEGCDWGSCCECGSCGADSCGGCDCGGCDCDCGC